MFTRQLVQVNEQWARLDESAVYMLVLINIKHSASKYSVGSLLLISCNEFDCGLRLILDFLLFFNVYYFATSVVPRPHSYTCNIGVGVRCV